VKFGRRVEPGASVRVHPEEQSAFTPITSTVQTAYQLDNVTVQCWAKVENDLLSALVTVFRLAER